MRAWPLARSVARKAVRSTLARLHRLEGRLREREQMSARRLPVAASTLTFESFAAAIAPYFDRMTADELAAAQRWYADARRAVEPAYGPRA